jgi:peptidoglycan/xylan/chitin deacetylase (PgdA/CDA1 family)
MWCLSLSLFKEQINFIKKNTIKKIYKSETLLTEIPSHGLSITFDDGYLDTYKIAAPFLIENNVPFTVFIITNFIKNKKKGYMDEIMLKELSNNPLVTIGSHTVNHHQLNQIDDKLIFNELNYSKSYLEDLLGKQIEMLSYPHGKFNIKIKQKVFDSGYKLAFSSKFGVNKKNQDKLALNRSEIWSTDEIEIFNEKLEGNWDWLKFRNL